MSQVDRLPSRFPDGTRYVIEGRDGRILSRYLEFPDGRHVDLPADIMQPPRPRALVRRRLRKRAARNSRP
jgi:hypothetical protein